MFKKSFPKFTTILSVRKNNQVILIGDGQVTLGHTVIKGNAIKLRKIGDSVIGGFAGSAADGITLFEALELKMEQFPNQLQRACVELTKQWRQDKFLRTLEAEMIVSSKNHTFLISGSGEILEPSSSCVAIGSGGNYALSAALALIDFEHLSAEEIALKSMKIASEICIYTNKNFNILKL